MINWLKRTISGNPPRDASGLEPSPINETDLADIRRRFRMPKFFLFGYPRSGTTLLMRLIRLHPKVHCNRQMHMFTYPQAAAQALSDQEIRSWLERPSNRWTAEKNMESSLVRLVADFILEKEGAAEGKTVVGDKSPTVIGGLAIRRLKAVYPDARLIYLVRDGRDTAVSRRFQRFIDQPQTMTRSDRQMKQDLTENYQNYSAEGKSIFTPAFLEAEAVDWARNLQEIDGEGQALFPDHYFCLRYEDLLSDPYEALTQLWTFLQVPPSFSEDRALIQGRLKRNPGAEDHARKESSLVENLKRGTAGGWQDWFTDTDRQAFKEMAGDTLVRWNYEKDLSW